MKRIQAIVAIFLLQMNMALAMDPAPLSSAAVTVQTPAVAPAAQSNVPFQQLLRPSRNPINAYRGTTVPPPSMANSARLSSLIRRCLTSPLSAQPWTHSARTHGGP